MAGLDRISVYENYEDSGIDWLVQFLSSGDVI